MQTAQPHGGRVQNPEQQWELLRHGFQSPWHYYQEMSNYLSLISYKTAWTGVSCLKKYYNLFRSCSHNGSDGRLCCCTRVCSWTNWVSSFHSSRGTFFWIRDRGDWVPGACRWSMLICHHGSHCGCRIVPVGPPVHRSWYRNTEANDYEKDQRWCCHYDNAMTTPEVQFSFTLTSNESKYNWTLLSDDWDLCQTWITLSFKYKKFPAKFQQCFLKRVSDQEGWNKSAACNYS